MQKTLIMLLCCPLIVVGQFCDSLLLESITNPGPFSVNSFDEASGIRIGTNYTGSTIYFPTNSSNINLSSIVMVPGFMNTEFTVQNWGPFLASHGIITMTIGTNSLSDNHIQRRDALIDAIASLKEENQRQLSPLFGKMDTNSIAVGGFSKGGGGAQLVPSIDSSIKAIISLYPWLDNPTSSDLNHDVPLMIISGQLDLFAPPSIHADIHYNLTPNSTKKIKYEIAFASHDALSGPYAGAGDVGIRVVSWLQTFLLNDSCYCPIATLNPISSSSFVTNVNCSNISVNSKHFVNSNFKKRLKTIDFFGREIDPKMNTPFIAIYDDGTVEKRIVIE